MARLAEHRPGRCGPGRRAQPVEQLRPPRIRPREPIQRRERVRPRRHGLPEASLSRAGSSAFNGSAWSSRSDSDRARSRSPPRSPRCFCESSRNDARHRVASPGALPSRARPPPPPAPAPGFPFTALIDPQSAAACARGIPFARSRNSSLSTTAPRLPSSRCADGGTCFQMRGMLFCFAACNFWI